VLWLGRLASNQYGCCLSDFIFDFTVEKVRHDAESAFIFGWLEGAEFPGNLRGFNIFRTGTVPNLKMLVRKTWWWSTANF
jgi:hypothetical protein